MPVFDAPVPDGVHLGLAPKKYFRQECRGSSDWIKIRKLTYGWWWQSAYNPDHEDTVTSDQNYGSALHSIILEGVDAYERAFAVEPDPKDYPDLVVTEGDIKLKLLKEGFDLTGTSKNKKADWNDAMARSLPHVPCWDNVYADFKAMIGERAIVSAQEDRMLRFMRSVATEKRANNAEVAALLLPRPNHPPLAEVSVFATIEGIRRRWRFDRFYPAAIMDLKSLGGWRGRPLRHELGQVLATNCWDMQRADYAIGRGALFDHVAHGRIFGGAVEERRYLQRIVAEEEIACRWIWIGYQKPDPKGVAPIVMPVWDEAQSDIHLFGGHKLAKALQFYQGAVEEFGLDEPWAHVAPTHYTNGRAPSIVLPHWIAEDEPMEAEAYAN